VEHFTFQMALKTPGKPFPNGNLEGEMDPMGDKRLTYYDMSRRQPPPSSTTPSKWP
jgi:hypothetical protein